MELWETAVNCISLPTSYDAPISSTGQYGTHDSMSRGCTSRNILHRVFIGQDLTKLHESSSPSDPEPDNNAESDTDEQDTAPAAGFQPFTTESDNEDTGQVTANAPLSVEEKAKYKAFLACSINSSHTSDHDLQYLTAAQVANAGDAYVMFRCPAYQRELDDGLPAFKFYRHVEEPSHWRYFNAHGIQCEFKCGRGFLDETHRFVHYQPGTYPEMQKLSPPLSVKCLRGGPATDRCSFNRNKTFGDHHWMIKHWLRFHATFAYQKRGFFNCPECKMGFVDMGQLAAHYQSTYGAKATDFNWHAAALKSKGILWTPDLSYIEVSDANPTYSELYFQHMRLISDRKDHAIFVFRQSVKQDDFYGAYLQKIKKIAAKAAIGLQDSKRAGLASAAVLSSWSSKSRMLPSFASEPPTKMEMVSENHFEGPSTKNHSQSLRNQCHNAARATFNITNQIVYAKMHGSRPLLVLMGTNSLSSN